MALDENICVRLGSDIMQEGTVTPDQAAHNHLGQYELEGGGHLVAGHRAASSGGAGRGRNNITASLATVTRTLQLPHECQQDTIVSLQPKKRRTENVLLKIEINLPFKIELILLYEYNQ